jgi:hypothetical protein
MGLMMVISTLFEIVVLPIDLGPLKAFLPKDDLALRRELTRAFLSYLGVEPMNTNPPAERIVSPLPRRAPDRVRQP